MKRIYTILGIPRPQGRPRFFRRGNFVGTYDPKESRQYKENVSAQLVAQQPALMEGPVMASLLFMLPKPKSLPKKVINHVKKPDLDNLIKGTFDACKGILWHDDTQVVKLTAIKAYGVQPQVIIEISNLEDAGDKHACNVRTLP